MSRRTVLLATGAALGAAAIGADLFSPPQSATAAGTYLRPCGDVPISSTWQGHRNRKPPSGEPGTDYAVAIGTPIRAATAGVIVDRKDTTDSATGRYIALRADDGNYIRYLHLASSTVRNGTRVSRGQVIAYSGASGFGSETGYGSHVHVSLWIGGTPNQLGFTNTVNFENFVEGGPLPTYPEDDPVPTHQSTDLATSVALPANTWTTIAVAAGQLYLAIVGVGVVETADVSLNLKANGLTTGLQVRLVAEKLASNSGPVVSTHPQPVTEIRATAAAGSPTQGQHAQSYQLAGPMRLFVQVMALNSGVTLTGVSVRKNYWIS
ncbi:M23 family metallopeptidase [Microbacterium sp. 3J1]|uniref:M23 family metallopeptidase n=1 Tax=Microbacterium sp. 3J1 TaxID=861269 RepID=UPI00159EC784|nr:M23 family metallopeptidase [Microbacterium sp. 3J1]